MEVLVEECEGVKRRVFERKEENRKESKEWMSRPRENKVDWKWVVGKWCGRGARVVEIKPAFFLFYFILFYFFFFFFIILSWDVTQNLLALS